MKLGPFRFFETKAVPQTDDEILALLGSGQAGLITKAQAMEVSVVKSSIAAITDACATLDIKVVEIKADGSELDAPDHPISKLLQDHVNAWTSAYEFVRTLIFRLLTEDAGSMAWVNRVDGDVVEILIYAPGVISVEYDETGEPSYKLGDRPLDSADVIHLRSAFDRSPLTMALKAISTAWHLENHALQLFRKGARPGGVIEFPGQIGDESLKKMGASWRKAHEGSDNAGRTALLWGGAKFTGYTLNSTDAQFIENRSFQVLEICRHFRIGPGMVYDLGRVTYNNGEQQGQEFLSYSLEPHLRALEAALRRALLSPEDRAKYRIVFDRDDLTRASLKDRAVAINSLIASETINPNTGREWIGLQPYTGGETYGNRNISIAPANTEPA
jgi:HK97 family phage portal protein